MSPRRPPGGHELGGGVVAQGAHVVGAQAEVGVGRDALGGRYLLLVVELVTQDRGQVVARRDPGGRDLGV